MKVLFLLNGLTHYYNRVLSRLNEVPGLELAVIAPANQSGNIGAGVYQTMEGINFKVIPLEETRRFGFYATFKGLARVLRRERPDAVIVIEYYLNAFLIDVSVVRAMKANGSSLILKSIPFRYLKFQDARLKIFKEPIFFKGVPPLLNDFVCRCGLGRLIKQSLFLLDTKALRRPDAHVNYVEAYKYWESYGISMDKIFITRNSPDTDLLFAVRKEIVAEPPILPPNQHRLLHVGRLVEWKRVDLLLHAFARLRTRFPGSELLIIGSGPEEKALQRLSQELRLGTSVSFLGGIYDQHLLGRYMQAASLYILAGMGGLSINEAMCYRLPVVCSVCDGTEKMLVREGFNGRYFRDGDEADLVDKITWFFEHPEQLAIMGRRSEDIIRKEVNIHTVIKGYIEALHYVGSLKPALTLPGRGD